MAAVILVFWIFLVAEKVGETDGILRIFYWLLGNLVNLIRVWSV